MMKVIQVGIGGMGNAWINAVRAFPEVEYGGFVEVNPGVIDQQVAQYGFDRALIFPSLSHALAAVKADGIIDVTPPQFHPEVSITALEAGIPVLSEKPLAISLEQGEAIVQKANATGILHMVAQNYRYGVAIQTIKEVLLSGEFGSVGSVSVEFFKGPHFGGFREQMAYPLIVDMAIHHFDLMRFFLDADPVSVFGESWNPSWSWYRGDASAAVVFEFPQGCRVNYSGSWCSQGHETPWNGNWRFECERGVILLQDDRVFLQSPGGRVREMPPVERAHTGQIALLQVFYEAVRTGTVPATCCQDNIKSLAMVFGALQSFEHQHRITLVNPG